MSDIFKFFFFLFLLFCAIQLKHFAGFLSFCLAVFLHFYLFLVLSFTRHFVHIAKFVLRLHVYTKSRFVWSHQGQFRFINGDKAQRKLSKPAGNTCDRTINNRNYFSIGFVINDFILGSA